MPIKILKQVIAQFRQNSECPYCKIKFQEDDVLVLMSSQLSCLFFVGCNKCAAQAFVTVELAHHATAEHEFEMRTRMQPGGGVSYDEVLDMKNFLKEWKGDLRDLFKK